MHVRASAGVRSRTAVDAVGSTVQLYVGKFIRRRLCSRREPQRLTTKWKTSESPSFGVARGQTGSAVPSLSLSLQQSEQSYLSRSIITLVPLGSIHLEWSTVVALCPVSCRFVALSPIFVVLVLVRPQRRRRCRCRRRCRRRQLWSRLGCRLWKSCRAFSLAFLIFAVVA